MVLENDIIKFRNVSDIKHCWLNQIQLYQI